MSSGASAAPSPFRIRASAVAGSPSSGASSRSGVSAGASSGSPLALSSSGFFSISSAMKLSTSRLDSASSRIACWSCGVITSDWLCRRSRRGPRPMMLELETLAEIEAAYVGVADQRLGAAGEEHLAAVDDAGAIDDVQRLADIMVGDEHADVALLQLA